MSGITSTIPTGAIKSTQRGTIALTAVASNTATITAVDTSKSVLRYLGQTSIGSIAAETDVKIVLTNSTTITATRDSASNSATVSWELTEYY